MRLYRLRFNWHQRKKRASAPFAFSPPFVSVFIDASFVVSGYVQGGHCKLRLLVKPLLEAITLLLVGLAWKTLQIRKAEFGARILRFSSLISDNGVRSYGASKLT